LIVQSPILRFWVLLCFAFFACGWGGLAVVWFTRTAKRRKSTKWIGFSCKVVVDNCSIGLQGQPKEDSLLNGLSFHVRG
jgi:hypothetical protein